MSIETTLLGVRNPKWVTLQKFKLDSDRNYTTDSDGKRLYETLTDSDGNAKKAINCECKWSHLGDNTQDWLWFTANPEDTEKHGRDLYAALVNGDHGTVADE